MQLKARRWRPFLQPTNQWIKQQIRHVIRECEDQGIEPRFFIRDNDMLYPDEMDAILNFFLPLRKTLS